MSVVGANEKVIVQVAPLMDRLSNCEFLFDRTKDRIPDGRRRQFCGSGRSQELGQRLSADVPVSVIEDSVLISGAWAIVRDLSTFGMKLAR